EEAGPGTRVGLSLKGIETEELSRGMFLANSEFTCKNEIKGNVKIHPAIKNADTGGELFVSDMMMYERGTYDDGVLVLKHKIPIIKKEIVISAPNSFPRIIGTIESE
ncbi:MAG: GTPase, partial [Thermoplasmata archaeon]